MLGYEQLLANRLATIPDHLDKREGSLLYTALAPVAAMITEQQWYADNLMDATMADTALGDDLTRKCAEHGVNRYPASHAVRKALFCAENGERQDVPTGTRFGTEGITYVVSRRLELGVFELTCEVVGKAGNGYFGAVLPIDNPYLGSAVLGEVLIPGEETESDEELRMRYYLVVNSRPFGGNIAQYKENILAIPGVGGVKVFPTPENQGGKVQCVIVDADFNPASKTLLAKVQEVIHPAPSSKGYGLAPIGHDVTISTVEERTIHITSMVATQPGFTVEELRPVIQQYVEGYLQSLVFRDNLVRVSRIDAAILSIEGVADISGTVLDGSPDNRELAASWNCYEIPRLGSLTILEMS